MRTNYCVLDWDSKLLGETVVRIEGDAACSADLRAVLDHARRAGARLAYAFAGAALPGDMAGALGGRLVDEKRTYRFEPGAAGAVARVQPDGVEIFRGTSAGSVLEDLAVQSGEGSRFAVDPDFPRAKFVEMYQTWIRKSVAGERAESVLTVSRDGRIAGMITLDREGERGRIGLLAVDRSRRGSGLGQSLVRAANAWFADRGVRVAEVVTQGRNAAACRLYERCGYVLGKTEFVYHFWL